MDTVIENFNITSSSILMAQNGKYISFILTQPKFDKKVKKYENDGKK